VITIIDVGISNIKSITRGFVTQGFQVRVTTEPGDVAGADSLVLPGVGAFPKAMELLHGTGLYRAVKEHVFRGRPLLGVCLGMQLLMSDSEEHGHTAGLGLVPGHVVKFPADRPVPHMGWNEVKLSGQSVLFEGIPDGSDFYFVHSYCAQPDDAGAVAGYSDHFGQFAAALRFENVFGTQFHPEKSQDRGLKVLENFARLTEK
jgi:glutamine amidotransferase